MGASSNLKDTHMTGMRVTEVCVSVMPREIDVRHACITQQVLASCSNCEDSCRRRSALNCHVRLCNIKRHDATSTFQIFLLSFPLFNSYNYEELSRDVASGLLCRPRSRSVTSMATTVLSGVGGSLGGSKAPLLFSLRASSLTTGSISSS